MKKNISPTDIQNTFDEDDIIVSKTDLKGYITYVNDVFCKVAEANVCDLIGKPHRIIRHPDMPRCVFQLLWQQIEAKKEIFAFVKNMALSGNYYWVFAHVSPTLDDAGNIVGYHSNRRQVPTSIIPVVSELYKSILEVEKSHSNTKEGMNAGFEIIVNLLNENKMTYDEFVWSLFK